MIPFRITLRAEDSAEVKPRVESFWVSRRTFPVRDLIACSLS